MCSAHRCILNGQLKTCGLIANNGNRRGCAEVRYNVRRTSINVQTSQTRKGREVERLPLPLTLQDFEASDVGLCCSRESVAVLSLIARMSPVPAPPSSLAAARRPSHQC